MWRSRHPDNGETLYTTMRCAGPRAIATKPTSVWTWAWSEGSFLQFSRPSVVPAGVAQHHDRAGDQFACAAEFPPVAARYASYRLGEGRIGDAGAGRGRDEKFPAGDAGGARAAPTPASLPWTAAVSTLRYPASSAALT